MLSVLLFIFGLGLFLYRFGLAPRRLYARVELWQTEADALPVTPIEAVVGRSAMTDAELLRELHRLHEDGVLTDEEYEKKKSEILERM